MTNRLFEIISRVKCRVMSVQDQLYGRRLMIHVCKSIKKISIVASAGGGGRNRMADVSPGRAETAIIIDFRGVMHGENNC
ncbi:hypothetical protein ACFLT8_05435 [Chloroflexota bacterium]